MSAALGLPLPSGFAVFLGAIELGVLLSSALYGVLFAQSCSYFRRARSDAWHVKALVGGIWALESVHTVLLWTYLHRATVARFGAADTVLDLPWDLATSVALSGAIGGAVQAFVGHRVRALSRSFVLPGAIWAGAAARAALGIVIPVLAARAHTLPRFEQMHGHVVVAALCVSAATDALSAAALAAHLIRAANPGFTFERTARVLDQLVLWSVETGLVTCTCAAVILILWLAQQYGLSLCLLQIYTKLYSISLLLSLNSRSALQSMLADPTPPVSPASQVQFARPPPPPDVELALKHARPSDASSSTWRSDGSRGSADAILPRGAV